MEDSLLRDLADIGVNRDRVYIAFLIGFHDKFYESARFEFPEVEKEKIINEDLILEILLSHDSKRNQSHKIKILQHHSAYYLNHMVPATKRRMIDRRYSARTSCTLEAFILDLMYRSNLFSRTIVYIDGKRTEYSVENGERFIQPKRSETDYIPLETRKDIPGFKFKL